MAEQRRLPESGDPGHSPARRPGDGLWQERLNDDASRMGLDRNTVEGAQVHFFASLDPDRPGHKVVAWVFLLLFLVPLALAVVNALAGLVGGR